MIELLFVVFATAVLVLAISHVILIRRVGRLERRRSTMTTGSGAVTFEPLTSRYFNGGKSSVEKVPES